MNKINPEVNKFVLSDASKYVSMESKFIIKPLGILLIIILLLSGSIYFSLGKINLIRAKIGESQKSEKLLNTKVNILQNVDSIIPSDISFIDLALPSKGVVIYGMSQVKNQASALGLLISDLKTGSASQINSGVSKVTISFDVEGEEQAVYDYLELFSKLLPLMKVDKVDISKINGVATASTTVSVFSGELPTKIPSLTTPVTDLTNDETKILNEILGFKQPQFILSSPNSETPKEDPFN